MNLKVFNRTKMIGILLVTIMISGAFFPVLATANEPASYNEITVDQARRIIDSNNNIIILDVRNQSEYDLGHLYSANLIPKYLIENATIPHSLPSLPSANDNITQGLMQAVYESMQSSFKLWEHCNDTIIVYCAAGSRSAPACQILVEHGFTNVYNMIGGIKAWMQAGYPVITTNHYVTARIINEEVDLKVEPYLLRQLTCSSCNNQSQPCANNNYSSSEPISQIQIEDNENGSIWQVTRSINGVIYSYTINQTTLWRSNESTNLCNRTIILVSNIITGEGNSTQIIGLRDQIQYQDYNLTISTLLTLLDSETYNHAMTNIEYVPFEGKTLTTLEYVKFDTSVSLSELYLALWNTAKKIGGEYAKSEDAALTIFANRYDDIAKETKKLSEIIQTEIPRYDRNILNCSAIIQDYEWSCTVCQAACTFGVIVGCGVACYFTYGAACALCVEYGMDLNDGCQAVCEFACTYNPTSTAPYWGAAFTVLAD